ncbi:hypothetical protein [Reichenbachiella versicolor]|uniref:hypothetical protein n=1 Tax=Reichenbachiella versicolor TaxID=1821036 RepID=UPI000D6E4EEC|nr:hypothetical protein [Reichenbachiella versicolor]
MTVHQISIKVKSGYNLISVDNYIKMSAKDRVGLISQKRIQFLDVEGNTIPLMRAVKSINKAKAA